MQLEHSNPSEPINMALRETLRRNPKAVIAGFSVVILLCLVVIYRQTAGPDFSRARKVFYSDDDGKTWFLDDPVKGSPFDHDGKQAYRALVYRGTDGKPFVAFLAKYSERQKKWMAAETASAPDKPARELAALPQDLKKPGETNWTPFTTPTISGLPDVSCPGGYATPVASFEPDSGASN